MCFNIIIGIRVKTVHFSLHVFYSTGLQTKINDVFRTNPIGRVWFPYNHFSFFYSFFIAFFQLSPSFPLPQPPLLFITLFPLQFLIHTYTSFLPPSVRLCLILFRSQVLFVTCSITLVRGMFRVVFVVETQR